MPITLNYLLGHSGWADFVISNGTAVAEGPVSYLHDSLLDLANAAVALLSDSPQPQLVLFMGEPGEHRLLLTPLNASLLNVEVRSYDDDCVNGELQSDADYEVMLQADCTPTEFGVEVERNLKKIWLENGPLGYEEKWLEHKFPTKAYETLTQILSTANKRSPS
jgi:hypothetical protein